jgi:hypothetical protein
MKQFNISDLSIETITLTDASIENPDSIQEKENTATVLRFGVGFEKFFNIKQELILVNFHVDISCLDDSEKELNLKGKFTTRFIFQINGLSDYIEKNNESKINSVDQQLEISFLNLVYSTSRGIIYTRCLGTVLGPVILPVLSSQELLKISEIQKIPAKTQEDKGEKSVKKELKKKPVKKTLKKK